MIIPSSFPMSALFGASADSRVPFSPIPPTTLQFDVSPLQYIPGVGHQVRLPAISQGQFSTLTSVVVDLQAQSVIAEL